MNLFSLTFISKKVVLKRETLHNWLLELFKKALRSSRYLSILRIRFLLAIAFFVLLDLVLLHLLGKQSTKAFFCIKNEFCSIYNTILQFNNLQVSFWLNFFWYLIWKNFYNSFFIIYQDNLKIFNKFKIVLIFLF